MVLSRGGEWFPDVSSSSRIHLPGQAAQAKMLLDTTSHRRKLASSGVPMVLHYFAEFLICSARAIFPVKTRLPVFSLFCPPLISTCLLVLTSLCCCYVFNFSPLIVRIFAVRHRSREDVKVKVTIEYATKAQRRS